MHCPEVEQHGNEEAEEVDDAQHLEHEDKVHRLVGVHVQRHLVSQWRVVQRTWVEGLLAHQVAKDKGGALVGEGQKGGDLASEALEDGPADAPPEAEEPKDKLEGQTPDHMPPDHMAWVLGAEEADKDKDADSKAGDQSPAVVGRVQDQEDGDGGDDQEVEQGRCELQMKEDQKRKRL